MPKSTKQPCPRCGQRDTKLMLGRFHSEAHHPRCDLHLSLASMQARGWARLFAPHRVWLGELGIPFEEAPASLRRECVYENLKYVRTEEVIEVRFWAPRWATLVCGMSPEPTHKRKLWLSVVLREEALRGPALAGAYDLVKQSPWDGISYIERANGAMRAMLQSWIASGKKVRSAD